MRRARLSDGTVIDVDVVVASLGSIRNVEWLEGARLATGFWGVGCDAGCRAFDINGVVTDNIFVAGDVARAPHVLYDYEFMSQEHWDNAVFGAEVAANNMINLEIGPASAPAVAVVLVRPVRRQHQERRGVLLRRRDRLHPGLGRGTPLRRRLRRNGPHRRRGHLQPRQVVAVLRLADRAVRAVPAPTTGLRPAREPSRCRRVSRIPREPDGHSRCRADRTRPDLAGCRIPSTGRRPRTTRAELMEHETAETAWAEAMKFENRPNPYPFFDELRKTPVAKVSDKTYVVTGYRGAVALSHDPRISSDISRSPCVGSVRSRAQPGAEDLEAYGREQSIIVSDPPDHDRMRRQVMRHFGPPHSPDVIPSMDQALSPLCQRPARQGQEPRRHPDGRRRRLLLPDPGVGDLQGAGGADDRRTDVPRLDHRFHGGPMWDRRPTPKRGRPAAAKAATASPN